MIIGYKVIAHICAEVATKFISLKLLTYITDMSLPPCRSQSSGLAFLILEMQKNADQVEKDILRSEDLLAVVSPHWQGDTNVGLCVKCIYVYIYLYTYIW